MTKSTPLSNPKLGKKSARKWAVAARFSDYFHVANLPTPPAVFGGPPPNLNWEGMLGNDRYGNCVCAGAAHETIYWDTFSKNPITTFTAACVLSDYSAVTGFNTNDPYSDEGTDMGVYASYRKKTGILDAHGKRHKVSGYLGLQVANINELILAAYLFNGVGFGFEFPSSAMSQFNSGSQIWSVVSKNSQILGGHYVNVFGRNAAGNILLSTWGKTWSMTPQFAQYYNDETIAWVSVENINAISQLNPEGLNIVQLLADLGQLPGTPNPKVSLE